MAIMDPVYFLLLLLMLNYNVSVSMSSSNDTVNIAAVLDVSTPAGKAAKWSLDLALQHLNDTMNGTRLNLTIHESGGDVGNVLQVFRNEVVAILVQDPKISKFLAPIAEAVDVPILSFSGVLGLGAASGSKILVSAVPGNYYDMKAIAAIVVYFQWKEVVVLYEDQEFWLSGVYALIEALQQGGKRISQTATLSAQEDQIRSTLLQLNTTNCVRAFIVYTSVDVALNMFSIADELVMMTESYAWVITDSIASSLDSFNSSSLKTMQGILGIRSLPTPQFKEMKEMLQLNSSDDCINRIGIQANSSLTLVAKAVAALLSQDKKVGYNGEIPNNDTDFPDSMKALTGGELLRQEIMISLKSNAINGETSEYEIINVVGERSYRRVGFWRKDKGQLQSARKEANKLSAIIWPGDTAQSPNGYRKLVIGKIFGSRASNFSEFIGRFSGYTNDIFDTAVNTLPYNLPFVYEAFNSTLFNYDALVTEFVNGKKLDAVVGDATILWNRSLFVDFSQPFTQTGMVMMVPLTREGASSWTFLRPFTAGLWAVAAAFFVFTAFLVWLMERHDNREFSGGITKQIVTSLTLSFSAFVFSHKEDLKSGLGKGIVAMWLFMALILNNSYTAHLTSVLTVDKLVPTLTNMKSLTTSNVKVGYMNTSFAKNYLTKELNISQQRLVALRSPYDYVQKLISGEVGAIVDENPYIQIVKTLYPCAKVAVVDRGYFDTGGLGFFFRKGSPFLSDITQAVLNISEQHCVVESIRSKWFGDRTSCPDLETGLQSNTTSMSPANVWTLLVFTASIYVLTALIHIGRKLQKKREDRRASNTQVVSTPVP